MDINEIRANLSLGGARNSLFNVTITNPANSIADIKVPFLVHATSIPASTLGIIPVGYMGRKVNYAGDRVWQPWQVTIYNDEDFLVRNAIETWNATINSFEGNINSFGSSAPALYKSRGQVNQLSRTGATLRTYNLDGIWPAQISEIPLEWSDVDQIESFSVIFMFDTMSISGATGSITG